MQCVEQNHLPERDWVDAFVDSYNNLDQASLGKLQDIYDKEVQFIDPMHDVKGLEALHQYFHHMYENLLGCEFIISDCIRQGDDAAIYWTMRVHHKAINKGEAVVVDGHSLLKQKDGLIYYHRDYFDLGQLIYENLPVLGSVVRWIKARSQI